MQVTLSATSTIWSRHEIKLTEPQGGDNQHETHGAERPLAAAASIAQDLTALLVFPLK